MHLIENFNVYRISRIVDVFGVFFIHFFDVFQ